jgi:hypothetical protein
MGDSIQLYDVDCRKSVCKVTYSLVHDDSSETAAFSDPDMEIMDHLVEGFGGADLDISYARNPKGENIMYIQLL